MAAETITYTYDARGRLVKVVRTGSVNNNVSANYSYDKADNRTNVNVVSPNRRRHEPARAPIARFLLALAAAGGRRRRPRPGRPQRHLADPGRERPQRRQPGRRPDRDGAADPVGARRAQSQVRPGAECRALHPRQHPVAAGQRHRSPLLRRPYRRGHFRQLRMLARSPMPQPVGVGLDVQLAHADLPAGGIGHGLALRRAADLDADPGLLLRILA